MWFRSSLITLSENGIAILKDELIIKTNCCKRSLWCNRCWRYSYCVNCFAFGNDLDIEEAISFANLAAGVVVGKIGSATASLDEIYEYESSLHKSSSTSHIKTFQEIEKACL